LKLGIALHELGKVRVFKFSVRVRVGVQIGIEIRVTVRLGIQNADISSRLVFQEVCSPSENFERLCQAYYLLSNSCIFLGMTVGRE